MPPIKYETASLKELFELDESKKLVLPNYQRDFVWSLEQQKNLLCSLLAEVPMGSLLLLQGTSKDYSSRPIAFTLRVEPYQDCKYLLDGQQRLSVIRSVFSDLFSKSSYARVCGSEADDNAWLQLMGQLFSKLRRRWFLRISDSNNDNDLFGYKVLRFPRERSFEPSDYSEVVVDRSIFKGNRTQWFHPAWHPEDLGENLEEHRLRVEVASKAAAELLIPLWEIFGNPSNGVHRIALRKVAALRAEQLRAAVQDGELSMSELFAGDALAEDAIASGDKAEIDQIWYQLQVRWEQEVASFMTDLLETKIPTINLPSEEVRRGVFIFETINRGGTSLSVFDLTVARLARLGGDLTLPNELIKFLEEEIEVPDAVFHHNNTGKPAKWSAASLKTVEDVSLSQDFKSFFLNYLGIHCYRQKSGSYEKLKSDYFKKAWILGRSAEEIRDNYKKVAESLRRALCFLQFRCGIINDKDIKYKLMILPIAAAVESEAVWQDRKLLDRIEYWYWVSLFGGSYQSRQNEQCAKDMISLIDWTLNKRSNPFKSIEDLVFKVPRYSDKNAILREDPDESIVGSIEDGILQFILSQEPMDLVEDGIKLTAWSAACDPQVHVEDHHIIPLLTSTDIGHSTKEIRKNKSHILNSAANRTFILAKSNRDISGRSVEDYMRFVEEKTHFDHFLPPGPNPLSKNPAETDDEYYKRILGNRFEAIRQRVMHELHGLVL